MASSLRGCGEMSLRFWNRKEKNEKPKENKIKVDKYILITMDSVRGAIGHSTPTVDGMRPFLDVLDKIPSFNSNESERIVYKPIGILYEAAVVMPPTDHIPKEEASDRT